ncbi:hypothetical protein CASFOL_029622 [Castilleja foliolosa]|uniref:C2H2-type domain-containing protein n=1 Tax=Castilleja foliolosa TaxID=1961234 RepID=A0ABD3C952_9LAMI
MFPTVMSNSTFVSSNPSNWTQDNLPNNQLLQKPISTNPQNPKKKRNLPGNPDPDAEVIALSPQTLMATNRYVCEICNKGFQRDQNLQLHRRGHNLPWKLKNTRNNNEMSKKKVYICPEPGCVHHHPSRALGDLTGIKKHFCRKHGEKKWKCERCSKIYAVRSDWKAHSKICGTREYKCHCGTIFSRKDSFITHKAFCDALAEESSRLTASISPPNSITNYNKYINYSNLIINNQLLPFNINPPPPPPPPSFLPFSSYHRRFPTNIWAPPPQNPNPNYSHFPHENQVQIKQEAFQLINPQLYQERSGAASLPPLLAAGHLDVNMAGAWQKSDYDDGFTRDFLGMAAGDQCGGVRQELLSCAVGVEFPTLYGRDHLQMKQYQRFG